MQKATVKVGSDIALVKYWGKKDEVLRLPENGSIAMKLDSLHTITTVAFDEHLTRDEVVIQGESEEGESGRAVKHLDRIRTLARSNLFARVVSQNTFPKATGLSSSSSGFAALTIAVARAIGLSLSQKELSILARQGSGSACRCVCGGWVEWLSGDTSESSYSESIFSADYWDVRDIVVVVDEGRKKISSTEGHMSAQTSIAFTERQRRIGEKIEKTKRLIADKNFPMLGELVEAEALEFHSILLTSTPPMIAWYPGTVEVMREVQAMREEGIQAYFTINTGFNIHVLTLPQFERQVKHRLGGLSLVKKILTSKVGGEPEFLEEHLF